MMSYIASVDLMATQTEKTTVEYPTGYTSSALPFYTELDDKRFEHFCNALLNLHPVIKLWKDGRETERKIVEANLLLGGNAQKGADIWAKDDKGEVWIFQCKHTKSFGRADVLNAIALAEKGFPQADRYVLVITCGLREDAQKEIRSRPKWLSPWGEDRLTIEVVRLRPREEAINLVHRFFPDWVKRLFPCSDQPLLNWQDFFQRDLVKTNKYFRHTVPFVPWSDALSKLEAFAQTGAGRALILSAPGGQGKSRLLLELAQGLEKKPPPRVCFLNLTPHGLSGEQSDYLAREDGDLLLVVDDAHRMVNSIEGVAWAAAKVKSIRLLIATRPETVDAISTQLYHSGYAERLEKPLQLPRWERDDIYKLAERVLAPERCLQASDLADLADRCPLLVVLGAGLINSGESLGKLNDERSEEHTSELQS